jgi:hypothetical protein
MKPRTIYMDDATWDALRKTAFDSRRTVSDIIREAVEMMPGKLECQLRDINPNLPPDPAFDGILAHRSRSIAVEDIEDAPMNVNMVDALVKSVAPKKPLTEVEKQKARDAILRKMNK